MLTINLEWDADALAAPQSFRTAVQAAASILDAAIYNSITVNIEVGYGEYDLGGPEYTTLSSNESLGGVNAGISLSYTELKLALAASDTSAADAAAVAALPATAPANSPSSYFISTAVAKALGVVSPTATAIDGYVGFPTSFTGNTLIGAAIVEEVHALGLLYPELSLFSYTGAGTHYFDPSSATSAYFSLDGGKTDLANYDVGFDDTLFDNQPNDPLDTPIQGATTLTALDREEIGALGFDVTSPAAQPAPLVPTTTGAAGGTPSVTTQNVSVAKGHQVSAVSLIRSLSIPSGDSVVRYDFEDAGTNGDFVFAGTAEPDRQPFSVLATELNDLVYVGGSATGTETLYVAALDYTANVYSTFAPLTATTTAAPVASDFNGDGRSDLVLQNTNGSIVVETQSNLAITGGVSLGDPGPAWHVVATTDITGDGQPDLLLQNEDGSLVLYQMTGTAVTAGYFLGNPGATWHVRGSGDFTGDGKADIVVQDAASDIEVLVSAGSSVSSAAYVITPGLGWTVEGVADLNGDGSPDILVQNTSGQLVDYLMNGTTIAAAYYLGSPGAGWAVAGTGDFNGDGKADILLHDDNGQDVIWETNGTAITKQVYVGNPGASYTAAVTNLDLNGDGIADLVVQNTASTLVGYTIGSNAQIAAGAFLGSPGTGWTAIGNNPVMFITAASAASGATLAATPGLDQFDVTTFPTGTLTLTGFDPAQDTIVLGAATFPTYATVVANETASPTGTTIALSPGATSSLFLQGVTPTQLTTANFILR